MNVPNNPPAAPPRTELPGSKLLVFAMAGFLTILTETMPAGLLPQISAGLTVSEALAGQLVTLYALGSVLAAIPIIAATRGWNRRTLFLMAIGGLLIFNTITALSTNYWLTLGARFVAGMAAGVVWGLLAGYVRRLVAPRLAGRALAVAGVGQPIALAFGVPLGTWLGTVFDWRGVFWIMSALALLLLGWVRLAIPDFEGQTANQRQPVWQVLMTPGVVPVLGVLFAWVLAHNTLYTYIAPYLASVGMAPRVDAVLLLFGVASIAGIWITGVVVDRRLRGVTLLSVATFALASLVLSVTLNSVPAVLIGIIAWGLAFGGAPTLLQTALADAAGEAADVAQSILVTIFNLAVAGGGLLGAFLLERNGAHSLPRALIGLALLALLVAWLARTHGFPSGHRQVPLG